MSPLGAVVRHGVSVACGSQCNSHRVAGGSPRKSVRGCCRWVAAQLQFCRWVAAQKDRTLSGSLRPFECLRLERSYDTGYPLPVGRSATATNRRWVAARVCGMRLPVGRRAAAILPVGRRTEG